MREQLRKPEPGAARDASTIDPDPAARSSQPTDQPTVDELLLEHLVDAKPAMIVATLAACADLPQWVAGYTPTQHQLLARVLARLPSRDPSNHAVLAEVFTACADAGFATMQVCFERRFDVKLGSEKRTTNDPAVPEQQAWTPASLRRMWTDLDLLPPDYVEQSSRLSAVNRTPVAPGSTTHGDFDDGSNTVHLSFDDAQLATLNSARLAAASDPLHDANFFDHAVRHEIGHSVDAAHKFSKTMQATATFGHWNELGEIADVLLRESGLLTMLDHHHAKKVTETLELMQIGQHVPDVQGLSDEAQALYVTLRDMLQKIYAMKAGASTRDDGGGQVLNGRLYFLNDSYNTFYSYDAAARDRKVSNYQLYSPPEFFAEAFAAYYEPNPGGPGALLARDPALRAWFDANVHPVAGVPVVPPR